MFQPGGLEKHPIRNVIVDDEGTIFTSIPAPSDGNQVVCFPVSTSSYDNIHTMDNL